MSAVTVLALLKVASTPIDRAALAKFIGFSRELSVAELDSITKMLGKPTDAVRSAMNASDDEMTAMMAILSNGHDPKRDIPKVDSPPVDGRSKGSKSARIRKFIGGLPKGTKVTCALIEAECGVNRTLASWVMRERRERGVLVKLGLKRGVYAKR